MVLDYIDYNYGLRVFYSATEWNPDGLMALWPAVTCKESEQLLPFIFGTWDKFNQASYGLKVVQ